jgi:hypothetical protein
MLQQLSIGTAVLIGALALVNGIYMLVAPEHWYFAVPGVTNTGAFNQHFLRDIGLVYLFVAAAFLIGAERAQHRVVLWAAASLWLGAHALFHVWEVAVGICAPSVLVRDFPAVTLPALIGAGLTLWAAANERMRQAAPTNA